MKAEKVLKPESQTRLRTLRGVQRRLLAPPEQVVTVLEAKGVIYTKRWVVELLLDLAHYRIERNLVDAVAIEPAAGDGAFLGPMISRLIESCRRLDRPISDCSNSLIAYELERASADHARSLVVEILREQGVNSRLANSLAAAWVRTGDYLFEAMNVEADFVLGNPPYVRLEDIPEDTARLYRESYRTMRGRADLYVAFFEAALRQLKVGGVCAFICADRWMRNQYGGELREFITGDFGVEIVLEMHSADAFQEEVDAYPAITLIRRKEQGTVVVATAGPEAERIPRETLSALLKPNAGPQSISRAGIRTAYVNTWFNGKDPWPCNSPEQLSLLRRLEENFPALESSAKVGIGVATGNDGVFITKDTHLVEPSRMLKLAIARDISGGKLEWSGNYLVDPWDRNGLVDLKKYPKLSAYLNLHSDALKRRHTAVKNLRAWYKTIDRVTHALTEKPKLYIADIKNSLDPVLDRGETYPHHNLYFVSSCDWNLEVLGGLLLSSVGQFFMESYGVRMRGGYLRFQAQYLRRIRLPNPKSLSKAHSQALVEAFRERNRQFATEVALQIYGIHQQEMETALGH